jgi:hypothetical protein
LILGRATAKKSKYSQKIQKLHSQKYSIFPKIPKNPQKSSIFPKILKNPQYSQKSSKIHKNPKNP